MTGVESQTPVPQETDPSALIISAVSCTPEQIVKAFEVGTHGVSIFTLPTTVFGPHTDWQVMVYSQ
jgi:hypothetical protein